MVSLRGCIAACARGRSVGESLTGALLLLRPSVPRWGAGAVRPAGRAHLLR